MTTLKSQWHAWLEDKIQNTKKKQKPREQTGKKEAREGTTVI